MEERILQSIHSLEKEFSNLKQDVNEIKNELKEHREIEKDILVEIGKLKTHFKWLAVIGVTIIGLLTKQFFFTP